MRRRTIENVIKYSTFTGLAALIVAYFGLSFFKPSKGLEEVLSREFSGGDPTKVISKYEETTSKYSVGLFYSKDNADYSDGNRPPEFFPTDVFRFDYKDDERRSVFVKRKGQKQDNPVMEAGKSYIVQFTCPEDMKSIEIMYGGIEKEVRIIQNAALKKQGLVVVKAEFDVAEGGKDLSVNVHYRNGERDVYKIKVIGK